MKLLILIIRFIMLVLGVLLFGFILYYYQGSLELSPSKEQHEKARIFSGTFIVLLTIMEVCLFLCQRKMNRIVKK